MRTGLLAALCGMAFTASGGRVAPPGAGRALPPMPKLRVSGRAIVKADGSPLVLKGMQFAPLFFKYSDALHQEFNGTPTEAQYAHFLNVHLGTDRADGFYDLGERAFFNDDDAAQFQALGMNCVRYRFTHWSFEQYDANGNRIPGFNGAAFDRLDRFLGVCRAHGIYVILAMGPIPGGTFPGANEEGDPVWQEGPDGEALRERFYALWEQIAARYKDMNVVAGYDLVNEPRPPSAEILGQMYRSCRDRIRDAAGSDQIIFYPFPLNLRAAEMPEVDDAQAAYTFHFYWPTAFTHQDAGANIPYPGNIEIDPEHNPGVFEYVDKERLRQELQDRLLAFFQAHAAPGYLGEFGAKANCPGTSQTDWVRDVMALAVEERFKHINYYTYKLPNAGTSFSVFTAPESPDVGRFLKGLIDQEPRHTFAEADFTDLTLMDGSQFRYLVNDALYGTLRGDR